jgi:transcription elongation GreA/GreB family factor
MTDSTGPARRHGAQNENGTERIGKDRRGGAGRRARRLSDSGDSAAAHAARGSGQATE